MSTPRDSVPAAAGSESGAFDVAPETAQQQRKAATDTETQKAKTVVRESVAVVKNRWSWLQQLRPYRAFSRFTDVSGSVLAAGMSYQAVFAVFAALWVCFGVLGIWLSGRKELLDSLVAQINVFVPGLLGSKGVVSVGELLASRTLDWTSLAAGFALVWVTLKWFTGTRRSIRVIFGLEVKKYRNAVLLKLRDLSLALLFLVALIISAALTVLTTNFADWLFSLLGWDEKNWLLSTFGVVARYAFLYAFDLLLLLGIVYFLAEVRVNKFQMVTGCALGAAALWVLKILGAALLGGASSNPLLASFAVFVGLLLWFNLICRTVLLTAAWIATGVNRDLGAPDGTSWRLLDF